MQHMRKKKGGKIVTNAERKELIIGMLDKVDERVLKLIYHYIKALLG